jgi:alpha-L-fucosidase
MTKRTPKVPDYLRACEESWQKNPHAASLQWFKEAGSGLFLHFSPASVLAGGTQEWIMLDAVFQQIHNRFHEFDDQEYQYWMDSIFTDVAISPAIRSVWDRFSPDKFDADSIADLAVAAGMKYITFTTRHVIGRMFLFKTQVSPCNSVDMSPHRDFVRELANACAKRDLALFLYVMPPFDDEAGRVEQMLKELLTQYGPIAGIWFDGISRYYQRPDRFEDLSRTYQLVRTLQPACLISFKTGASGEEDFIAPEIVQYAFDEQGRLEFGGKSIDAMRAQPPREALRYSAEKGFHRRTDRMADVWHNVLRHKPIELCRTMMEKNTWFNRDDVPHASIETVRNMMEGARRLRANLLLNTGPLGDGSIHPQDRDTLLQIGQRRQDAVPKSNQPDGVAAKPEE